MIIKGKSFSLRPYRKDDKYSLTKNLNDEKISRFMCTVPYPYRIKDAEKFLDKCLKLSRNKNKNEINMAIDKDSEVIGGIGFREIEGHRSELGYWIARKHWNSGIMTEAIRLFTKLGFKKLKFRRIQAHVNTKNKASARVLEKNNYKREGLLRKFQNKDGKFIDCYLYAKIR